MKTGASLPVVGWLSLQDRRDLDSKTVYIIFRYCTNNYCTVLNLVVYEYLVVGPRGDKCPRCILPLHIVLIIYRLAVVVQSAFTHYCKPVCTLHVKKDFPASKRRSIYECSNQESVSGLFV